MSMVRASIQTTLRVADARRLLAAGPEQDQLGRQCGSGYPFVVAPLNRPLPKVRW